MSASTPPSAPSSESTESPSVPETPESPKVAESRRKKTLGVAMGIGSAAIVAALLYANRSKRSGK
jgi:hypothetical protein